MSSDVPMLLEDHFEECIALALLAPSPQQPVASGYPHISGQPITTDPERSALSYVNQGPAYGRIAP